MTITDLLVNLDCILWLVLFFIVLHQQQIPGALALNLRFLRRRVQFVFLMLHS